MPEGDTVFRAARTLNRALAGQPVRRFRTAYAHVQRVDQERPVAGRTVEKVEARGKHLLLFLSGGLVLHTHMRMNGSWHLYRPGERWRAPASAARLVLETDPFVAVGFNVPVAELLSPEELERHASLRALGPDLLSSGFDAAEAQRRLRLQPEAELGAALLDQRAVAGAGNVFKSEVLFAAGVSPFRRVGELSDAELGRVVELARRFLKANVHDPVAEPVGAYDGMRRTTGRMDRRERLYVYGRAGLPCRRCGAPVQRRAQDPHARLSYFCVRCQR
jgi:endonuclease-8